MALVCVHVRWKKWTWVMLLFYCGAVDLLWCVFLCWPMIRVIRCAEAELCGDDCHRLTYALMEAVR